MSVITSSLQAITSANTLNRTQDMLSRSLSRLSSGQKIASPVDDAAGFADASRLDAQNLRVSAASTNVQNAISYVQTGDSALANLSGIVTRMGELASMAQDPTKNASDVALYQQEFQSLQDQLRSTVGGTTGEIGGANDITAPLGAFNGVPLFAPTASGGLTFAVGQASGQDMTIPDVNLRTGSMLGLIGQDASGQYTASVSDSGVVGTINGAIQQLSAGRATFGAADSRLNLAASSLQVESQNLTSALSGIRDVDVAQESTQYAKYNILMQSGTAMLAQANQSPQAVLKLLQA